MVRWCCEDSFFGYLPPALAHQPVDGRSADPKRLWGFSAQGALVEFIMNALAIASGAVDVAPSGARRLKLLGRRLGELASRPWQELRELVRAQQWRSAERAATHIELITRGVDASHPWARDARAFGLARLTLLRAADNFEALGSDADRSPESRRERLQRLLRRYGELLEAWPEIFDAAKSLRQQGRTLCKASDAR
jgi:hypothetical protein